MAALRSSLTFASCSPSSSFFGFLFTLVKIVSDSTPLPLFPLLVLVSFGVLQDENYRIKRVKQGWPQ